MPSKLTLKAVTRNKVNNLWLETDLAPEWRAAYRLVVQNGVLVIGEVRVLPRHGSDGHEWTAAEKKKGLLAVAPVGGVRATMLRRVRIPAAGEYLRQMGQEIKRWRRFRERIAEFDAIGGILDIIDGSTVIDPSPVDTAVHQPDTEPTRPRRGRKGKGEAFYARVARTYVAEVKKGKTRGILAMIVRQHRLGNIGQARAAVYRAREMGLLGGRKPGRAYGVLTAKAKAILTRRGTPKRKPGAKVRPSRRPQRSKAEG